MDKFSIDDEIAIVGKTGTGVVLSSRCENGEYLVNLSGRKNYFQEDQMILVCPAAPWYPDDSGEWVEVRGQALPALHPETWTQILTAYERSNKSSIPDQLKWRHVENYIGNVVAYRIVKNEAQGEQQKSVKDLLETCQQVVGLGKVLDDHTEALKAIGDIAQGTAQQVTIMIGDNRFGLGIPQSQIFGDICDAIATQYELTIRETTDKIRDLHKQFNS